MSTLYGVFASADLNGSVISSKVKQYDSYAEMIQDDNPGVYGIVKETNTVYHKKGNRWIIGFPIVAKENDYTAWEVYPTLTNKAVGEYIRTFIIEGKETTFANKEAIPANATEFIKIFTSSPAENSDVIVDWGDGSVSVIANGDYSAVSYEDNGETVFDLRHTYTEEDYFIVRVYGKGYWKISHPTITSRSLMSRVFADDLPVAGHLLNLAAFAAYTDKLLYVDVPPYHQVVYASNLANLFTNAQNLQRVTGFKRMYNTYCVGAMFNENIHLNMTDFRFSPDVYAADKTFKLCSELAMDVNQLFQHQDGRRLKFKNSYVNLESVFDGCSLLTGSVTPYLNIILWDDDTTEFKSVNAFRGATGVVNQVPVAWGGTMEPVASEPGDQPTNQPT